MADRLFGSCSSIAWLGQPGTKGFVGTDLVASGIFRGKLSFTGVIGFAMASCITVATWVSSQVYFIQKC